MELEVHRIVSSDLEVNCYVVSGRGGDTAIVDPGESADQVAAHVAEHGLKPHGVLLTHAHDDHLATAADISDAVGAPIHMHSDDTVLLRRANLYRVVGRKQSPIRIPTIDVDLAGRTDLALGSLAVTVIHTPGHTPGSVCFAIGGELFTGDAIFPGRTALPEEDRKLQRESLRSLAKRFPPDMVLRPGHGEPELLTEALRDPAWSATR